MQWFLAAMLLQGIRKLDHAAGSVTSSLDTVPVFVHLDIVVQNIVLRLQGSWNYTGRP